MPLSRERSCRLFQGSLGEQQLKAGGWGRRKIFKDKEAGGWADGGGWVYTPRTAGTANDSGCKTPAFVPRKQQVKPQTVHTPDTLRESPARSKHLAGMGGHICLFQSISQQLRAVLEANLCLRPLPVSHEHTDNSLPSETPPPSRSQRQRQAQSHRNVFDCGAPLSTLPSWQTRLGFVYRPSTFHIIQKSVSAAWSRFKEQSEISF